MIQNEEKKQAIIKALSHKDYKPLKISELSYLLGVSKDNKDNFNATVNALISSGDIFVTKNHKLILPEALNIYKGVFQNNVKGFGFVKIEGLKIQKDIFVPKNAVHGAMHKDIVLVQDFYGEGEIIKIINRHFKTVVGKVEQHGKKVFVQPTQNLVGPISIQSKSAVPGHYVVAKIIAYPKHTTDMAKGEITEILGHENDPGVDILTIIKEFGLITEFPREVLEQAEQVSQKPGGNRVDLRHLQIITIDGEDAKDLDDGISLSYSDGRYTLGVHIADVAHYVEQDTPLDKEAASRGTSTYLVDRVIPMLPHVLSNGVCSLTQGEDRLALSCIMDIDEKGRVLSHQIQETVIHVAKRMTYTNVAAVLEENAIDDSYLPFIDSLHLMNKLGKVLRQKRLDRGALDFGIKEAKVVLGKNGNPIDIVLRERNQATKIIEEFMLVANETIAEEYYWLQAPFIYRVHSQPDKEKLEALNEFILNFGYRIKGKKSHPKSVQDLLTKIKGTKEEPIISHVTLRSLKHAQYSGDNNGHFGLAAKYYCHFTSPIRRYPDLFIHRVIKAHINGRPLDKFVQAAYDSAYSSSVNERKSEEAERAVLSYKKAQYMEDKVGQDFHGIISSVTSWGIYVQLSNTVEGMVKVSDIKGDFVYDKKGHRYIGVTTKRTYSLGDQVNIRVVRAGAGKVDFIF